MKRYDLSAQFVRWQGHSELLGEPDGFRYVLELESDDDASTRLDTLIIDRMASRPGWSYKLLNAGYSEFDQSQKNLSPELNLIETIELNVPTGISTTDSIDDAGHEHLD